MTSLFAPVLLGLPCQGCVLGVRPRPYCERLPVEVRRGCGRVAAKGDMLGSMGEGTRLRGWVASITIAVAVSGTFAAPAWADAGTDLDAGEAAYAGLDYDRANGIAQKVVATRGLSHEQVVRAYRLLGRTYAVLGKSQQAIDAFQKLLTYAPDEKTDSSQPPRIQEAFSDAQGFWAGYQ